MNQNEKNERYRALRRIGCIACIIEGNGVWCGPPEVHHLNSFGHAGMKRRGDEFTICLGSWHHRGVRPVGMRREVMTHLYGPSLALDSKQFRFAYGDDDSLLAITRHRLAQLAPEVA